MICAGIGNYTQVYYDDTDERPGGCRMSWMLSVPHDAPHWLLYSRLCYQWYPEGDEEQCGGGVAMTLCAHANHWTTYYRDNTDDRSGGCRMAWKWELF